MHTNFVLFAYFNLFYVGTMKFGNIMVVLYMISWSALIGQVNKLCCVHIEL
jgi:hypothetical protein